MGEAKKIVEGVLQKDRRAASRLMSMIEANAPGAEESLKQLYPFLTAVHVIGITGYAGVGKSSLINQLVKYYLQRGEQVGIIASDPTSPFSSGSLLGDRERMKNVDGSEAVFVRSVATRGSAGGIAQVTRDFIKIMQAVGKERIIVETVGVSQDQVAVMEVAQTIIVVVMPGMGDYLQSLKAGVLEIADLFVVNKADRGGVNRTVADLKMLVSFNCGSGGWQPPIVKTIALKGEGVARLAEEIEKHRLYLEKGGQINSRREMLAQAEILDQVRSKAFERIALRTGLKERVNILAKEVVAGKKDPYTVADEILDAAGLSKGSH